MTTNGVSNLPRDERGKWRRQVENADRDARAAELAAQGRSYDDIARELNYSDKAAAWRGARKAMLEVAASHGLDAVYQAQVEENRQLRAKMWQLIQSPPPKTDRLGRIVRDDNGNVVADSEAQIQAATVVLRAQERLARLTGVDAPKKSVSMTVGQASDILRQHLQSRGYPDSNSPEALAWFRGEAPLRTADGREFPPLTVGQVAELDDDLARVVLEARAED